MAEKEVIDLLVEGGKAAPGPTTAPRLSAYKLNIGEVFKQINERTKEYGGMQVPVKLIIDKNTKEFVVEVGLPPVSSLIKKELGIVEKKESSAPKAAEKGAVEASATTPPSPEAEKKEVVIIGNLTMQQCVKIAKMKMDDLLAKDLKSAVKTVIGTVLSMPVTIEGKKAKEILKEIDSGAWDRVIA
jgi:large subunit ribosomal protein L11